MACGVETALEEGSEGGHILYFILRCYCTTPVHNFGSVTRRFSRRKQWVWLSLASRMRTT